MKILYLTFHYRPDLGAGSFRNSALVDKLKIKINSEDIIEIITTLPHRYHSYQKNSEGIEINENIVIKRISLPQHKNGFSDQIYSFFTYYKNVQKITRNNDYDLIFASSSKLFTAFLAARISRKKKIPLYLDIRDIFADNMKEIIKSKFLKIFVIPVLQIIERYTVKTAVHLNLVSKGFEKYFRKYYKGRYSFYTNGIDDDFLTTTPESTNGNGNHKRKITYAGNIGEGQGLEKIIPESALKLADMYEFRIIGDGGSRKKLEKKLKDLNVNNVEIIKPVNRSKLKEYYSDSDFLFLHLNNYKAFEKVLPSKIFEYAATNKNIIAGVNGYAREFIKEYIPDALVFDPGNVIDFLEKISNFKNGKEHSRFNFISRFKRDAIMSEMAQSIIDVYSSP